MKAVTIPALLLAAAIIFVIVSGAISENALDGLIKMTEELPDEPDPSTYSRLDGLEKEWNKYKELFSAVIKFDFVYNFSKELSAARAGVKADDHGTYLAAKKAMLNVLNYIKDVQKLRLDNLI